MRGERHDFITKIMCKWSVAVSSAVFFRIKQGGRWGKPKEGSATLEGSGEYSLPSRVVFSLD